MVYGFILFILSKAHNRQTPKHFNDCLKTQLNDGESLDSWVSIISISDSDSDADTEVKTGTPRGADSRTGPVEETYLFNKIFDDVYGQYQVRHTTEEIDQLIAKLALAIPEQYSAEAPTTTAGTAVVDHQNLLFSLGGAIYSVSSGQCSGV